MPSYLHTMVRVRDLDASLAFYQLLGLRELRRREVPEGRYTLVFIGFADNAAGQAEIELTYNWGQDDGYAIGTGFGHFAPGVPAAAVPAGKRVSGWAGGRSSATPVQAVARGQFQVWRGGGT